VKQNNPFVGLAFGAGFIGAVNLTMLVPACSPARSQGGQAAAVATNQVTAAEPVPSCVPARPLLAAFLAEKNNVLRVRPVSNGSDGAKADPAPGWFDEAGANVTTLAGLDGTVRWLPKANGLHRTRTPRGGHKMAPIAMPYANLGPEWLGVAQMIKQDEATRMSLELTLPNGEYEVFLALGDASYATGQNDVKLSSGTSTVDLVDPDGPDHFDLWSGRVRVSDGRLVLSSLEKSKSARIVQFAIARVGVDPVPQADARPAGEVVKRFAMPAQGPLLALCPSAAEVKRTKN